MQTFFEINTMRSSLIIAMAVMLSGSAFGQITPTSRNSEIVLVGPTSMDSLFDTSFGEFDEIIIDFDIGGGIQDAAIFADSIEVSASTNVGLFPTPPGLKTSRSSFELIFNLNQASVADFSGSVFATDDGTGGNSSAGSASVSLVGPEVNLFISSTVNTAQDFFGFTQEFAAGEYTLTVLSESFSNETEPDPQFLSGASVNGSFTVLSTAVPEPSSASLILLGAVTFSSRRRR